MKTLFKIFILLSIAFPALCLADSERESFPAVVRIQTAGFLSLIAYAGTAFFIAHPDNSDKSNIVVTNFHVISKAKNIEGISIQAPSGKWHPVKAIRALDALNDLAVLEVEGYESEYYYLVDHFMDSAKEVETAGFPVRKFQHSHGQVLSTDLDDENQYTAFQKSLGLGGFSGSPVFKEDSLIAVLKQNFRAPKPFIIAALSSILRSYTKNEQTFDTTLSIATPVSLLRELLSKAPLHCQSRNCIENEIKKLQELAEEGDSRAQYRLAKMHHQGPGVEKSPEQLLYWMQKAAEQGHPMAQYQLASMYYEGLAVKENPKTALYWYTQAAEMGHPEAQLLLALLHSNKPPSDKLGVEKNQEKLLYWVLKAAEQGHPMAKALLRKPSENTF